MIYWWLIDDGLIDDWWPYHSLTVSNIGWILTYILIDYISECFPLKEECCYIPSGGCLILSLQTPARTGTEDWNWRELELELEGTGTGENWNWRELELERTGTGDWRELELTRIGTGGNWKWRVGPLYNRWPLVRQLGSCRKRIILAQSIFNLSQCFCFCFNRNVGLPFAKYIFLLKLY